MSKMGWGALILLGTLSAAAAGEGISAKAAFEKLISLEGTWEGHVTTPDGPAGAIEYRVTSSGNTVMEFQFPGTDHEMVSVYYLDGDDLVATHYCAIGNQPEMKLDAASSSEKELRFVFTGGTNLDSAKDTHIHGGKISVDGDRVESEWDVFTAGKREDSTRFYLSRAKD